MESKRVVLVTHMVQELENTNIKHQHFGIIIISQQVNFQECLVILRKKHMVHRYTPENSKPLYTDPY